MCSCAIFERGPHAPVNVFIHSVGESIPSFVSCTQSDINCIGLNNKKTMDHSDQLTENEYYYFESCTKGDHEFSSTSFSGHNNKCMKVILLT